LRLIVAVNNFPFRFIKRFAQNKIYRHSRVGGNPAVGFIKRYEQLDSRLRGNDNVQ
jgi:hypothetical protein